MIMHYNVVPAYPILQTTLAQVGLAECRPPRGGKVGVKERRRQEVVVRSGWNYTHPPTTQGR